MSLYSDSNLNTAYFDPKVFIANNRVSFELMGHHLAYLPNMRIINFNANVATRDTAPNRLAGVYGLIKNARLLDGSTELSRLNEVGRWIGFKNQSQDIGYAMNVRNRLVGCQQGFTYEGALDLLNYNGAEVPDLGTTEAGAGSYTVDLRDLFPILNQVSHLPTDLFKNLRVEIEYSSNALDQAVDANQAVTHLRPLLAVDYLDNEMIVKKMNAGLKGIVWNEIEHDSINVPQVDKDLAGSDLAVQSVNEKSNGFQNKHVERILLAKEINNVKDGGGFLNGNIIRPAYGPLGSYSALREKVQARLNGRNIFPREGITKPNEALGYLVDTWGEQNAYPNSNAISRAKAMTATIEEANRITASEDFKGAHSYFGFYLGDKVQDLQINYERTNARDTAAVVQPTSDGVRLHIFGEVRKGLSIQNGKYTVAYL